MTVAHYEFTRGASIHGARAPSTLLKAVADRETTIKRLEAELRKEEEKPSGKQLPDLPYGSASS